MKSLYALLLATVGMGCASLGPAPKVSIVKGEIKAIKAEKVGKIFIPAATGVPAKASSAVLAGTVATYLPPKGIPSKVISGMLKPIGVSKDVSKVMFAEFQAEFIKSYEAYKKKAKKNKKAQVPKKMKLPKSGITPKNMKGAKSFAKSLKAAKAPAKTLSKALEAGKHQEIQAALKGAGSHLKSINSLAKFILKKGGATYLLLTHIDGTEKDWKAGKHISVSSAMVNVKTGRFRYFATVKDKKGAIPVPFNVQVGLMTSSLFGGADEKAPVSFQIERWEAPTAAY